MIGVGAETGNGNVSGGVPDRAAQSQPRAFLKGPKAGTANGELSIGGFERRVGLERRRQTAAGPESRL